MYACNAPKLRKGVCKLQKVRQKKIKMCTKDYQEYFEAHGRSSEEIEQLRSLDSKIFKEENVLVKISKEEEHGGNNSPSFDVDSFYRNLRSETTGNFLFVTKQCKSTQDFITKFIEQIPIGSVCVADIQSHGRGRGGNNWVASSGGLLFSFSVSICDRKNLILLQYLGSIAVVETLREVYGTIQDKSKSDSSEHKFDIKWPNDIYFGDSKIGGVLCNSKYKDGRFDVSVGIGLNLMNEGRYQSIQNILKNSAKTRGVNAEEMRKEVLLGKILEKFEVLIQILDSRGFEAIKIVYLTYWKHSGQKISILETEGSAINRFELVIEGLTDNGYLLAIDNNRQYYELHPDGNSLDLFEGLIRKKVY